MAEAEATLSESKSLEPVIFHKKSQFFCNGVFAFPFAHCLLNKQFCQARMR